MKGAHWFVRRDQCGYPETEFPPRSLILLSVYWGVENVEGSGECVRVRIVLQKCTFPGHASGGVAKVLLKCKPEMSIFNI